MARISTHVLDTSLGLPARGMTVELDILQGGQRRSLGIAQTDNEGRTDPPLLTADRLEPGTYELTFHAADYFRRVGVPLTDPPFLGHVVIRVGIADPAGNYHVPLLISPYGYTTYRGS